MDNAMSQMNQIAAKWLLLLLYLAASTANSESYTSPESISGTQKIDAEGLIELVSDNPAQIIIDSRISSDRKLGYIPGSISLPDTQTSCESLAEVIPKKTDAVVFYCNGPSCRRSDIAVVTAADCGYSNIFWFRGGIEAWKANNYPITK